MTTIDPPDGLHLRNGDIGLERIEGRLKRIMDTLHGWGLYVPRRYFHAFMVYTVSGKWMQGEAYFPRAREHPWNPDAHADYFHVRCDEGDAHLAAKYMHENIIGNPYGVTTIFWFLVEALRRSLHRDMTWVLGVNNPICTEACVLAYLKGPPRLDIVPQEPDKRYIIGDQIADSPLTTRYLKGVPGGFITLEV